MNYMNKSLAYYSKWLGEEQILLRNFEEVQYVYSSERNEPQYGYEQAFDLYIFIKDDKVIVSYGDKSKGKINELKKNLNINMSANDIRLLVCCCLTRKIQKIDTQNTKNSTFGKK